MLASGIRSTPLIPVAWTLIFAPPSHCPGLLIVFKILEVHFGLFFSFSVFIPYEKSPKFWRSAFVLPAKDRLKVTSEAYESLKIARNVEKSITTSTRPCQLFLV